MSLADQISALLSRLSSIETRLTSLRGTGGGGGVTAHHATHEPGGADAITVPPVHHTRHESGGADPIKLDDLAAPDDNTDLNASAAKHGLLPKLSNVATEFLNGQGAFAAPATAAHHATHESGGGDAIKLDDLAAPDDNADLDASTSKHGLLKKLPGGTTDFFRADGAFATPPGTATYCFKPPTYPRRWLGFSQANVGGYVMGAAAGVSSSGTLGDAGDTAGPFRKHTCGTVTSGAFYISAAHCRQYWDPTLWMRIRTDAAIANIRIWAGFWDNATMNASNPAAREIAAFRFDTSVDGNWYFCVKDGTTMNAIDTGVAAAAATIYDMKISMSGGVAYWEITPFSGATTSGNTNSNLPQEATNLYFGFLGWATSGTVYYQSLYAYCETD